MAPEVNLMVTKCEEGSTLAGKLVRFALTNDPRGFRINMGRSCEIGFILYVANIVTCSFLFYFPVMSSSPFCSGVRFLIS